MVKILVILKISHTPNDNEIFCIRISDYTNTFFKLNKYY